MIVFLPTTSAELKKIGWTRLDIILVSGDTYIDSPFSGVAIIGKVLLKAGYRVGIIAQPNYQNGQDITRLGEPLLFWGVTSGCVDSMVANYTALKKFRQQDDFTPGGVNNRRPDRAVIVYANLIRTYFKNTCPIVLGGIEASLRRVAHYDYWSDRIRKSLLFDAKADYLIYGMGEKAILELAAKLKENVSPQEVRGLCYIASEPVPGYRELPSFSVVSKDPQQYTAMFQAFYEEADPYSGQGCYQLQDQRYLIQTPPNPPLTEKELDAVHELDFERAVHPYYQKQGGVKALETIKFSLTTHRGCYGQCNFCSIAVHQGKTIQSRSATSILKEAKLLTKLPGFKGYLLDVGGPTANMYRTYCKRQAGLGKCGRNCLFPQICPNLKVNHQEQLDLLKKLRQLPGIKKVFVASGIRYDLIAKDQKHGQAYLEEIVEHHISGQLKIAPEHSEEKVLHLMGKPEKSILLNFKKLFETQNSRSGKKQFLTYYLMAAHPGCTIGDMHRLQAFVSQNLHLAPEQVQIFTPLPATYSTVMYYTYK